MCCPSLLSPQASLCRRPVIDEAADEQIEPAVVVVVEPDGAGRPAGRFARPAFSVTSRECAVAIVADRECSARRRSRKYRASRRCRNRRPRRPCRTCHPRTPALFGHIGKCSVAIVFVERVANGLRRLEEIARTAVDQVDVHPAVVVVIEKGAPGSQGLGQIAIRDMALSCTHSMPLFDGGISTNSGSGCCARANRLADIPAKNCRLFHRMLQSRLHLLRMKSSSVNPELYSILPLIPTTTARLGQAAYAFSTAPSIPSTTAGKRK